MASDERLIEQIYSVVADPARWPTLLTTVSDEIGVLGGMAAYVNLGRGEIMMEIGRLSPVFAGCLRTAMSPIPGILPCNGLRRTGAW